MLQILRPLVDVRTVCALRDCDTAEVLEMIEEGTLPYAFNIASKSSRRELRIFSGSLAPEQSVPELPQVMAAIVPASAEITTPQISRAFNCDYDHVLALILAGHLQRVPGTKWRRGPGGAARVLRTSAIRFLEQRRCC